MSIKRIKDGSWKLDVRIWKDGKEYRQRENVTGGQKAAESRVHEIKKELAQRAVTQCSLTKVQSFGQILDYYSNQKMNCVSSPTCFNQMKSTLGKVPLDQLKVKFTAYWMTLRKTHSCQTGKFLANATVNHYTVLAKAALNMCVRDGVIEDNPLKHIQILKRVPRDIMLSDLDRINLINIIDREAPHLSAIVRFALEVPSRKSELVNLKVEDYDAVNNAVRIRHQNAKGKRGSWKPVPPGWLTEYFRNLPATEYVFYRTVRGKYLPLGNFKRSWTRCLSLAKITDFHFHDTRAVSATNLLNAGNPEQVVCQIAGWTSGNMIRLYYRKDGLRAVQNLIFPQPKPDTCTGHFQAKSL